MVGSISGQKFKSSSNQITIPVTIHGHHVTAIIDTAADRTVIKEEVARKIIFGPLNKSRKIVSVDGSPITSSGSFISVLEIEGELQYQEFLVLPDMNDDLLLGLDTIRTMPFVICCKTGKLKRSNQTKTEISKKEKKNQSKDMKQDTHQCENHPDFHIDLPEHNVGKPIRELRINEELSQKQKNDLHEVINTISTTRNVPNKKVFHEISTTTPTTPYQHPYRVSVPKQEYIEQEVQKLLKEGKIQHSASPYGAPVVLPTKKDGTYRFAIDYRKLNAITVKDRFPLPRIDDLIDKVAGCKYFATLDAKSGYHQVSMLEKDIPKTAFVTSSGQYEWRVMPFGLCNAPATFQRMMNNILRDLIPKKCLVYIDDILVFGKTWEDFVKHFAEVLHRLAQAGIILNEKKCKVGFEEIEFLGHSISEQGIKPSSNKVQQMIFYPIPQNKQELQRFLGLAGYFAKFISNYSSKVASLRLLLKGGTQWFWTDQHQSSFESLKKDLSTYPMLAHYERSYDHILYTDASDVGLGAVLLQIDPSDSDARPRPLAFASRVLRDPERRYSTSEKEALAVTWAITEKFDVYLQGKHFTVMTDHANLCGEMKLTKPSTGRLCRMIMKLQEYDFTIAYSRGKDNIADGLSRLHKNDAWHAKNDEIRKVQEENDSEQFEERDQTDDPMIKSWLEILQKHPNQRSISESTEVRSMYIQNGSLYKNGKFVLPKKYQIREIKRIHNQGHAGYKRTLNTIAQRFWWPKMTKQVKTVIEECRICQQWYQRKRKPGQMETIKVNDVMDTIGVDFVGPIQNDQDQRYIIVAVDYCSRFAFTKSIQKASSQAVISFLKDIFEKYGFPRKVISDNAKQFTSQAFLNFTRTFGIKHVRTTLGRPQANGLCERTNQTLLKILAKTQRQTGQTNLTNLLMSTTNFFNNTVHSTLGAKPVDVFLNRTVKTEIDNLFPTKVNYFDPGTVSINVAAAQERQKNNYDLKRREKYEEIKKGDMVWVWNANRRKNKLAPLFLGPKLVECLGDRWIQVEGGGKYNRDQILKFK